MEDISAEASWTQLYWVPSIQSAFLSYQVATLRYDKEILWISEFWVYHMDNRCLAMLERCLTSPGSVGGKDAIVNKSLEPVKASEDAWRCCMLGNLTGNSSPVRLGISPLQEGSMWYIFCPNVPSGEALLWCTPVLESSQSVFCRFFFHFKIKSALEQSLSRQILSQAKAGQKTWLDGGLIRLDWDNPYKR